MKRKSYDKQFKMAAVKLILEEEVPVSVVAKELEIHQNTLYRWVNEYEEHGESAFPGRGTALYSYQFEIKKIFLEHKGRYGSLRIVKTLELKGIKVNRKRVTRLMRLMALIPYGTRYRYKNIRKKNVQIY